MQAPDVVTEEVEKDYIFLPWDQVDWPNPAPVLLLLVLLLLSIALAAMLLKWRRQRNQVQKHQKSMEQLALTRHLTRGEVTALQKTMATTHMSLPELALVSRVYFDRFLAAALAAGHGAGVCEMIRGKLFPITDEALAHPHAAFPDTRAIPEGTALRIHFTGFPGRFDGLLTEQNDQGTIIAFPHDIMNECPFRANDNLEAVFTAQNALLTFRSRIVDIHDMDACTCLIEHSDRIGEIHHRESVRVIRSIPIPFRLFPAPQGQPRQRSVSRACTGTLRDMSLGGCAIATIEEGALHPDDRIQTEIRLSAADQSLCLHGVIRHVETENASTRILHIAFFSVDDAMRHRLAIELYGFSDQPRA